MDRKTLLAIAAISLAVPALASAASWLLNTRVMSGGGTLQVRNDTVQTSASGTIFKNYTTTRNVPITLKANYGYLFSSIKVNGTDVTPPASGKPQLYPQTYQMGLTQYPGVTSQSLTVSFALWLDSVTVNAATSGGSVSPYGTYNVQVGTTRTYTFTPYNGQQLVALSGLPASGYTLSPATIPAPLNTPVTLTLTVPETPLNIAGYYLGVVSKPGTTQYVTPGSLVTLDGTGSVINAGGGSLSYSWAQTSIQYGMPVVTLSNPNSARPTFVAPVAGTYTFQLTVSNGTYTNSATTSVIATANVVATARNSCQNCHQSVGIGSSRNVFPNWSSSTHKQKMVFCSLCHVGTDSGGHPGNLTSGMVNETNFQYAVYNIGQNFCFTCHHKGNNLHYNTEAQLANICVACHTPDVHNPASTMDLAVGYNHFNGYTSAGNAGYRAAYVTPAAQCADCHLTAGSVPDSGRDAALAQIRTDWSASGHADTRGSGWLANDFKTLSGCVQCHTAPGFTAYSTGKVTTAWGSASDRTRGVLSCNGCHSDLGSGALRRAAPFKPYDSDPFVNPDVATSNLCVKCHSGLLSGRGLKAQAAADPGMTSRAFIGSHSSAAAGILFRSVGYQFAFRSYSNNWHFKHDRIGKNHFKAYGYDSGSDGACLGCHMTSPNKHTFSPLARGADGAITGVTGTSCGSCHTGPATLDAARMAAREAKFAAALAVLQKVLEGRGIYYANTAPYFYQSAGNTDPGNAFTAWGNADTMGAAFNFNLLIHEPGAYAHNMLYSKRLIYDSIDYLDNGVLDDSVLATISSISGPDAAQKATAAGYLAPSGVRP